MANRWRMNDLTVSLLGGTLIGLGATLISDLWGLFLKHAFRVPPPDFCLVGRWLRYMPEGTFRHPNIVSSPPRDAECRTGWIAHYLIGVTFALTFVLLTGSDWLQHPTPVPAILCGAVTVVAPFFMMQPAFGLGVAASKTSNPGQARLRSLMNHTAFGVGLYLSGLLVSGLLSGFGW